MSRSPNVGDLVHIPQAVQLVYHENFPDPEEDYEQLTIPLNVRETSAPEVGVVTRVPSRGEYIRVLCNGSVWSVKNGSVYTLSEVIKGD